MDVELESGREAISAALVNASEGFYQRIATLEQICNDPVYGSEQLRTLTKPYLETMLRQFEEGKYSSAVESIAGLLETVNKILREAPKNLGSRMGTIRLVQVSYVLYRKCQAVMVLSQR